MLSILVISHNQKELLRRCVTSLLQQKIAYSYEIIISDDCSTDGTWEIIQEYQIKYPKLIRGVQCNSDDCNPTCISERCGWNKLNVYQHAKGKYFVNVDADDYLKSYDIYQLQINMLEAHPECSMCMQEVFSLNEGQEYSEGRIWPNYGRLKNGECINAERFILEGFRPLNQACMIRRSPQDNMLILYGKHFDDTIITLHHLQYGPVVFLDRADYVWIRYSNSITAILKDDSNIVIHSLLPIHHLILIPSFVRLFLQQGISELNKLVKILINRKLKLDKPTKSFLSQFNGFIYDICLQKERKLTKLRLICIHFVCLFIVLTKCESKHLYQMLLLLLLSKKEMLTIDSKYWRK